MSKNYRNSETFKKKKKKMVKNVDRSPKLCIIKKWYGP